MRIAILSDIHSNLEALEAVLGRARTEGATATWALGDIVGYGADPDAVVERLAGLDETVLLAGNHDLAATGRFDVTWFNGMAAAAIRWTSEVMSASALGVIEALVPRGSGDGAVLVHGSVVDPAAEYVVNPRDAERSFGAEDFSLCFFGHTHLPVMFSAHRDGKIGWRALQDGAPITIEPEERFMLNPGSVGQPRDGDARASFMIYDADERTAVVHRVEYDIDAAQRKILAAGLPEQLASRLSVGR